mmetsp:Transcript_7183/g.19657  ORF Transcript_7183/g.19657 Transcript_7183/m.19657 type:complete len:233 (+) Transcript_7183:1837-2535(+)
MLARDDSPGCLRTYSCAARMTHAWSTSVSAVPTTVSTEKMTAYQAHSEAAWGVLVEKKMEATMAKAWATVSDTTCLPTFSTQVWNSRGGRSRVRLNRSVEKATTASKPCTPPANQPATRRQDVVSVAISSQLPRSYTHHSGLFYSLYSRKKTDMWIYKKLPVDNAKSTLSGTPGNRIITATATMPSARAFLLSSTSVTSSWIRRSLSRWQMSRYKPKGSAKALPRTPRPKPM